MSSTAQKLFNFSRGLPEPFNTLKNKIVKVSSKYGDGTEAKLNVTVVKAVQAMCNCKNGTGLGAIGLIDHRSVAEYKSSTGSEVYHLAVFDPTTGSILASKYDKNTEALETYTIHTKADDGSAVLMAMLPELLRDDEFEEHFNAYYDSHINGWPDKNVATEHMAILCDNAYRRVVDDTCAAHIKVKLDTSGNVMRVSQSHLDSGAFTPRTPIAGEFTIFAQTGPAPVLTPTEAIDHSDFVGKYPLNPGRSFSAYERNLVPLLEPWYILPPEVVSICKHAQASTGKAAPMRNFLLRGAAGTGKTLGAQAIAAGLGLPYMKYTCSANSEIYDFIGQVFPETDSPSTGDEVLDRERRTLKEMGGMTYENVARLMSLPGLDDMDYAPDSVYKALTGVEKPTATSQDCMAVVLDRVTEKVQQLSRVKVEGQKGQTYTYVETDFVKALKSGYCVEIQEPSTIMQPGVLVGLNSLLEQTGSITLPTGEIIKRHPDAVVVVTTNINYEGCRGMNQSVLDRMSLVMDIELPAPEVMAQRAMSVTGCEDDYLVSQMVQVVNDMADYCRKNGITDGSCGMRSLIDWIISSEITGDSYTSALHTIISKATSDEEDRHALIAAVLEPIFAPVRRKAV